MRFGLPPELDGLRVPDLSCDSCQNNCSQQNGCSHAAYKCYVFVKGTKVDRDAIMASIDEQGVPCFSGSCSEVYSRKIPLKKLVLDQKKDCLMQNFWVTPRLMFLCHPTLTEQEVQKTCDVLTSVVGEYFR